MKKQTALMFMVIICVLVAFALGGRGAGQDTPAAQRARNRQREQREQELRELREQRQSPAEPEVATVPESAQGEPEAAIVPESGPDCNSCNSRLSELTRLIEEEPRLLSPVCAKLKQQAGTQQIKEKYGLTCQEGCEWKEWRNKYASTYASPNQGKKYSSLAVAKEKCDESKRRQSSASSRRLLGAGWKPCNAITCTKAGDSCTLRASGEVKDSPSGETTYTRDC